MGNPFKKPKIPPPPPPPPAPKDEADAINLSQLVMQRTAVLRGNFRSAFGTGPRGPEGPEWQAPETPPAGPVRSPEDIAAERKRQRVPGSRPVGGGGGSGNRSPPVRQR